jgi:hypothetical protein
MLSAAIRITAPERHRPPRQVRKPPTYLGNETLELVDPLELAMVRFDELCDVRASTRHRPAISPSATVPRASSQPPFMPFPFLQTPSVRPNPLDHTESPHAYPRPTH